jgi:hypothetical protein
MGLSNYLPSSRISQPGVCTSSTRPVSPYEGQVIYETDTDRTLIWNGSSWYPPSASTLITSLPSTPTDGQIINYVADSTNGIVWTFRYRSASSSAYKWEFIGGSSLYNQVGTNNYNGTKETYTSTSYGDLATVGPSVVVPFAGDYKCDYSVIAEHTGTSSNIRVWVTGDSSLTWNFQDSQAFNGNQLNSTHGASITRVGVSAGATIKLQYAVSNAGVTSSFWNRRLYVTPVRIG